MSNMLGTEARKHDRGSAWWNCCQDHLRYYRSFTKIGKRAQRQREKRQWMLDEELIP